MKAIYDLQKIKFKLKGLLLVLMLLFLGAQVMAQSSASTTAGPPLIICQGNSLTLTGNLTVSPIVPALETILWTWVSSPAGETFTTTSTTSGLIGNSVTTSVIPTLVPGASRTYTLTASSPTATFSPVVSLPTALVTVNSLPTATVSGTTSICQNGTSPNVTFTGATGTIPYVFSFNINGGTTTTVTTVSGSSVTVAAPTATAGTFTYNLLSVQDANGCSQSQTGSATITVDPTPTTATAGAVSNVCITGAATLAGNTPSVGVGAWSGTGLTFGNAGSGTSTVTASTAGTYVATWTITNGTCAASTATCSVTFDALPTVATAGAVTTVCVTAAATLAGNTPSVGVGAWSGTGLTFGNSGSSTSTVTASTAGTYVATWTITSGTCAASTATCSVTFDASPTVATAGAVSNVCITGAATLAGNTPSVGTGAWSGTGLTFGNAGSGTSTVTASTAGTYVATWTITNGTCAASTATCSVTFDDLPTTATAGSVATLCVTGTATLAGNIPSVGTGTWTKLTGPGTVNFGNAASGTSTATTTTAGTYTLQWSIVSGTCAASTATCSVTFDATPTTATAGAVANVCVTGTATLAGNTPSSGTGTWTQISGGTGTGTVTFGNAASGTSTAAATTAGSYILQWSIANGTCTASTATCSVTFDATPTTATAGPVADFCNNASGTLAGNTPIVGIGTWTKLTGPGAVIFGNANLGNSTVTITDAGTYTLQWSIANGTCTASTATCSVTVNPAPVATYTGASSVCVGATTPLSASGSWYGANWVSLDPAFATVSVSGLVTGVSAGTTTITLTLTSEFLCTTTHYFPMQVVATAGTPSAPSGATSRCQGAGTSDYTTSSLYATSYVWSVTGTGNSISGTSTTGTVTWAAGFSGSATILVTASNACGTSSTASSTVTVIPTVGTPTAPLGTTSRCSGAGTSVYTTSAANATSYSWSVTGTGNSVSGTSTTGTVTWAAGFSGSAVVSVTATNSCGTSTSTSTTVTVTPSVGTPSAPAGLTTICQGTASGTYTTTATNATSYTWYVTGTGNSISGTSTTGTVTWNPGFSGTANITVVANGCGTATSTATTVTVNPLVGTPVAPAGLTSICQGTASGTYTTTAANAVSYAWTLTPSAAGSIAGTSTTGTVTWNPSYSGTATILVSGTNGCGTATSTATTVTVKPLPAVVADYSPKPICLGATLSLIATPDGQTQYEWTATNGFHNTGPNSIITLNNVTSANNGIYTVTVLGLNGCSASASTTVTISETVGTPSAITVTGTEPTCQILNNTTTTTYNTTAAFASGYNWSLSNPAAGTLSSTTTLGTNLVTWTNGFSGTVSILVSANGCSGPSATVSRTITITPSVGIPTTPSGITSRCQGAGTSAYTTSASNATSYNWSVTGTGNSISGTSTTGTVTWAAGYSGSAVISVTATNSCGTSASATTTVTVAPSVGTPVAPSGLTTICQGTASGTYTTTATNATSYTWYVTGTGNSISGTSTTGTVTWSPSFNGDANITVVANGCGTATSTATTVHVTPTAGTPSSPSGITSRCQGAGTSAFTTSATNATSYTWSVSGAGNTISGTSTTGTVTWNSTFSGTAIISVFANGCGTSATATSAVTVTPAPDVTATSNSPVCLGGVLILTASSTAPNTNYAWTGPSSFIYSGPNTEITFSPMASANAGTYTLTVTAPGYCSVVKTVVVTLAPTTVGGTVASAQTICYNTEPADLTLSGNVGNVIEWQSSANAAFTSPSHIAVTSTTLLGTTIGSLVSNTYFRAMVQSGTCSVTASTSVLITVDPFVPAPTVTLTQPTCATATGTITITAPLGTGMTYSIGGTYTTTTVFEVPAGFTYTVTAKSAVGCISAGTQAVISEQPWTPPAPTVALTQPTCEVATGTITITDAPIFGATYSIGGTYTSTMVFTGVTAGTYTVTVKSMVGCISNGTVVTINAQPATPATPVVTLTQPTCSVATGTITITSPLGANLTYSIGGSYTSTTVFSGLTAGTYTVTARFVGGVCTSAGNAVIINTQPVTPSAPTVDVLNYCGVTMLTATGVTGATFLWSTGETSNYIVVNNAGVYTVTQTLGSCTSLPGSGTAAPLTIPAAPTVTVQSNCGNSVLTATGYTGSLLWNTGATTASITVTLNGQYSVTQTVGTCQSNAGTASVTVNTCGTIAGYVQYDNVYLSGMNGVTVNLRTPSGSLVASTVTTFDGLGVEGYYSFTNIAAGTYSLTADYSGTWLGNNATDALIVNLNTIGSWPLTGLRLVVADVNNDGIITGIDALMIKDRTSGKISSYPAGNWKFTSATIVLVTDGTVNQNLLALCTGDVNGSDIPGTVKSAASLTAVEAELMTVPVNQSFTYNIKSNALASLGAMTLFMNYDANLFTIDKINSSVDGMSYKIEDGRIAIAWSSSNPRTVKTDETVISLIMTAKEALTEPVQIFTINEGSEFADPFANKLANFDLKMSKVITSETNLTFSMVNYPNPFRNWTEIVYTIPVDGKVKLILTNMFGQSIRTLVDEQQGAGTYKVKVDQADGYLEPGLYLYSIIVEGTTTRFTKTNKMLFTR